MRFGGHETFPVREDWLSKGLFLLDDDPFAFEDRLVSDRLGVGRNMGKAIWHWLGVTGLVQKHSRGDQPDLTPVARTILAHDPYMLSIGTWWALHIHLIAQEREAIAWPWFFNRFARDRFDRSHCAEQLRQYVTTQGQKLPARKTLTRDVACLLASYAQSVPPEPTDPEDGQESPFRELGLVTYFQESDTYQINRGKKDVPAALVGYDLAVSCDDGGKTDWLEINLTDALTRPGGPGRAFALTAEALADTIDAARDELGEDMIQTRLMGSERIIQVVRRSPEAWLETYYRG
jgi:hypothetical protein